MKLILDSTGEEIKENQEVTTFRDLKAIVTGWQEPHHNGSTGRVYLDVTDEEGAVYSGAYFPAVCGARFIKS